MDNHNANNPLLLDGELILTGKVCPYCHAKTVYVNSSEVYSKSFGMIYLCRPCNAYVGVHKGTDKAKGRLANEELRYWKKEAHAIFDPIWEVELNKGESKYTVRNKAYHWLAKEMNIGRAQSHIGHFDVDECKRAIAACKAIMSVESETKPFHKETVTTYINPLRRKWQNASIDRFNPSLRQLRNKYGDDFWYDPKKFCYTLEINDNDDKMLIVDYFPKADKVLIRRENRWEKPGMKWLLSNLL